jgi:hypothetical protein
VPGIYCNIEWTVRHCGGSRNSVLKLVIPAKAGIQLLALKLSFRRKPESSFLPLIFLFFGKTGLSLACGERVTSLLVQRSNQETPFKKTA